MTASEATLATRVAAGRLPHWRHVSAGCVGNVLEWYDFAIYGYLAAAIGRQFFPATDPTASLLAAFAVFAVGFLMRPVGGVLIGHIGDRHGRRMALLVSVAGMAVPTVLIGLLPTYASIGLAAPVILIVLRMIQGIAVGGEYVGSMVFLVEAAPAGRRGLFGAFAGVGTVLGILIGSAAATLLTALADPAVVEAWAWRVPFLAGILPAFAGILLRGTVEKEPPRRADRGRLPIVEALATHPREIVVLAALNAFNAVGFYVSFVYVASWLQLADGIAPDVALGLNTTSMVILLFVVAGFGWLSDRIGRVPILVGATLGGIVFAWPLFWLMHLGGAAPAFAGQLGLVVLVGACGVLPATMVEAVGARVRVSAIAVACNVSMGIIGGLSPLVATWLIATTGDPLSPAVFVAASAALSFVATWFLVEGAGRPLRD